MRAVLRESEGYSVRKEQGGALEPVGPHPSVIRSHWEQELPGGFLSISAPGSSALDIRVKGGAGRLGAGRRAPRRPRPLSAVLERGFQSEVVGSKFLMNPIQP